MYTNLAFRRPYDKYLEEASLLETEGSYVVYFNYILTYAAMHLSKPKLNVSNTVVHLVPHTLHVKALPLVVSVVSQLYVLSVFRQNVS